LRATAPQPTVERAPKHAHGAPALPRRSALTSVAAKVAISAAASQAATSTPAATPTARTSSVATSADHATSWKPWPSIPNVDSAARLDAGLASFARLAVSSAPARTSRAATSTMAGS
jgi:hypothetical protein